MILGNQGNEHDDVPLGADNLVIGGVVYRNTAAKFWSSLFDEMLTDFPAYSDARLRFMTALCLDPALLDPQQLLERDMERLSSSSLEEIIRETVAESDLFGPPGAVIVEFESTDGSVVSHEISHDCADAEILPSLIAWLLVWASVPESLWNQESLRGDFVAYDRGRGFAYSIDFGLVHKHVNEGLYRWSIGVRYERSKTLLMA